MPSGLSRWVFVKIEDKTHHLWRAVDHDGKALEPVVTGCRNKAAALKLLNRFLKRRGRPETFVTDEIRAYRAALRPTTILLIDQLT